MVSGGMTLVKFLLFIFNLLFVISGIAIIAVGVMAFVPYKQFSTFLDAKFVAGPIILIAVGTIVFVIAFFGCCGAIRENHCMVVTYSVLLLTIFCIQLAAGICGYMYREDVKKGVEREFKNSMTQYYTKEEIHQAWDVLQTDLKCCGVEGPIDWGKHNMAIPTSCCEKFDHSDSSAKCKPSDLYDHGCLSVLKRQIDHFALTIGGVAIGIAFVQLLGVVLACCLARSIRKEYESV